MLRKAVTSLGIFLFLGGNENTVKQNITIRLNTEKHSEKFKTKVKYYSVLFHKFYDTEDLEEVYRILFIAFDYVLKILLRGIHANDLVRVVLENSELDYPIQIPFTRRSRLSAEIF